MKRERSQNNTSESTRTFKVAPRINKIPNEVCS